MTFREYVELKENWRKRQLVSARNKPGNCLMCGKPHYGDPDVESFCSEECEEKYRNHLKDTDDHDAMQWGASGAPDTPSFEPRGREY